MVSPSFETLLSAVIALAGRKYAELLREAAGFFELHPDMPVPDVYSSLVVLYEGLDEDAREVATIAQSGHGTLCFLLPSGESSNTN